MRRQRTLNDALNIEALPMPLQERTLRSLREEITSAENDLRRSEAQPQKSGDGAGELLMMMALLQQARQCCPQCPSARAPMPTPAAIYQSQCQLPPMSPQTAAPQQAFGQQAFGQQSFPQMPPAPQMPQLPALPMSDAILKLGASGTDVKRLQQLLRSAGYRIAADGKFGEKTEEALIAFQKARGIRWDGIVNDEDWSELEKAAGERTGATKRAEAGKNEIPSLREKAAGAGDSALRYGVPLAAGAGAGYVAYRKFEGEEAKKRLLYAGGIGVATTVLGFVGVNVVADAMTSVPEGA